jgi:hypothetical protein
MEQRLINLFDEMAGKLDVLQECSGSYIGIMVFLNTGINVQKDFLNERLPMPSRRVPSVPQFAE